MIELEGQPVVRIRIFRAPTAGPELESMRVTCGSSNFAEKRAQGHRLEVDLNAKCLLPHFVNGYSFKGKCIREVRKSEGDWRQLCYTRITFFLQCLLE